MPLYQVGEEVTAHECFLTLLALSDAPDTRLAKEAPIGVHVFKKVNEATCGHMLPHAAEAFRFTTVE